MDSPCVIIIFLATQMNRCEQSPSRVQIVTDRGRTVITEGNAQVPPPSNVTPPMKPTDKPEVQSQLQDDPIFDLTPADFARNELNVGEFAVRSIYPTTPKSPKLRASRKGTVRIRDLWSVDGVQGLLIPSGNTDEPSTEANVESRGTELATTTTTEILQQDANTSNERNSKGHSGEYDGYEELRRFVHRPRGTTTSETPFLAPPLVGMYPPDFQPRSRINPTPLPEFSVPQGALTRTVIVVADEHGEVVQKEIIRRYRPDKYHQYADYETEVNSRESTMDDEDRATASQEKRQAKIDLKNSRETTTDRGGGSDRSERGNCDNRNKTNNCTKEHGSKEKPETVTETATTQESTTTPDQSTITERTTTSASASNTPLNLGRVFNHKIAQVVNGWGIGFEPGGDFRVDHQNGVNVLGIPWGKESGVQIGYDRGVNWGNQMQLGPVRFGDSYAVDWGPRTAFGQWVANLQRIARDLNIG